MDTSEIGGLAGTQEQKRQHWTREMNRSLINAYYLVTEGGKNTKKYAEKLAERWEEIYPDKKFTGKHLIAQIRNIRTRKLLSPAELEAMKAAAQNSPVMRINNIRRSIHRLSFLPERDSTDDGVDGLQLTVEAEPDGTIREIREIFQEECLRWDGIQMADRHRIPKIKKNKDSKTTMSTVNTALSEILNSTKNLEDICHKVYCAAMVVNNILQTPTVTETQRTHQQRKPPWEERLEKKIKILRKEIGILHSYLKEEEVSKRVIRQVQCYSRRLKLKRKDAQYKQQLVIHMETLKQKLAILGSRLRRYHKRTKRYHQNNQFNTNQKSFFKDLGDHHRTQQESPKAADPELKEFEKYWSNIWSEGKSHNTKATWIESEKEIHANLSEMHSVVITEEDVAMTVKRMKNWTTAGIDNIHNYWWKYLPSTHGVLARLLNAALENPEKIPKFLTQGTTYMIFKKGDPTKPENYRPITCLSSAYKILTSTVGHKVRIHLKNNKLLAWEQNGCRRGGRGSKELLVVDNIITKQAKKKKKNISMAWIDYQKAFDSVPHTWLLDILKIYKVNPQVISLFRSLMSTWCTSLTLEGTSNSHKTTSITIRRGIFQGDGFSPLWFCLALNPLSGMLNRSSYGYSLDQSRKLTHLFYVDDLKLFARGRQQLEGELELVRGFSEDIGMIFGLDKCATISVRRGKLEREENMVLIDGQVLPTLGTEERYKYLGVQETYEIRQRENKEEVEKELFTRIKKVLNTQLSAKNKMTAINIWAIPAFIYTAGVLTWSRTDLERLDRKTRTTLTQYCVLHPNSAIERLYIPRRESGRGLSSLENVYLKEESRIKTFFLQSNLPVHQWVASQRYVSTPAGGDDGQEPETENIFEKWKNKWRSKPLHGRFYASLQQPEVDLPSTNTYLTQGYLYPQTEGTLMAIQDQVVPTRAYAKYIMKQNIENTKCRLCNNVEETVQHLSSGCSTIANTKYLSRHNNMGKVVHQFMCLREQLLQEFVPHHIYEPTTVREGNEIKIYWDLTVQTDPGAEHNRPDMVVWNKRRKSAIIIDFTVPLDQNLAKAYGEKIAKYEILSRQMKQTYGLEKVEIKPLVISCNGLVHRKTVEHLREMDLPSNTITWMQKAVILATVSIIRQVLFPH